MVTEGERHSGIEMDLHQSREYEGKDHSSSDDRGEVLIIRVAVFDLKSVMLPARRSVRL